MSMAYNLQDLRVERESLCDGEWVNLFFESESIFQKISITEADAIFLLGRLKEALK